MAATGHDEVAVDKTGHDEVAVDRGSPP